MLYIVIAVFIVLIIMNIFMLLVLRQMTISTGKQIEKDAVRLFGVYNRILDDRSHRLEKLDEKIIEQMEHLERLKEVPVKQGEAVSPGVASVVTGRYQDGAFTQTYQKIKSQFDFRVEAVIGQLQKKQTPHADPERVRCMQEIRDKFSFDTRYEISTLALEDQDALMEDVLEGRQKQIYHEFKEQFAFGDAQDFWDWINLQCKNADTKLTVRMGDSYVGTLGEDQVNLEYKPDICEGFQIVQGDKLYDYSI